MECKTISRRTMLKIGALTAGGLSTSAAIGEAGDATAAEEVRSCCQFCQTRCTTLVQVKGGRVVNVYGNPDNYWTEGGLCPKAQAVVELTYSPHRLLYPLKKDGSGWKRISYSEALNLVAEKILKIKTDSPEEHTHQALMFAPLWESRESELMATMAMKLSGFPDIYHPGDT
jgi:anaerobic selenocysteine-containing dehydrogenase